MDTLYELTGKHNGIVIHRNQKPIVCNWTKIYGLPRWFGNEICGVGEPVPKTIGHYYDDLSEWIGNTAFDRQKQPQRGMVYKIGDITAIAPDEWE